ncbi:uncharacterized protein LOC142560844 isoform X3 [Dermacentor variabilis]|uniref:uncharacterized protein LOC142560844 isoform X3 n=1 Tax=Dermacentor variabilis TaxID=34621 RepID=UPI003F5BE4A9
MRAKLGETSVRNCLFQLQNKGPSLQSPVTPVVCELTTSSLPHLSLTLKLYSTSPFILRNHGIGGCGITESEAAPLSRNRRLRTASFATATAGAVPFTLAAAAKCIACSPPNPCFIYRRRQIWKDCLSTSGQHLSSLFLYHRIAIYKDHTSATTRILNKYAITFRLA